MKKALRNILLAGVLLSLMTGYVFAQTYPVVPLDSVNFIPADSLRVADSLLAAGATPRASLTNGFYLGDTITVTRSAHYGHSSDPQCRCSFFILYTKSRQRRLGWNGCLYFMILLPQF